MSLYKYIFFAIIFIVTNLYSQKVYIFNDGEGYFGMADLSTGLVIKKYIDTGQLIIGTIDMCVVPDGRIYHSDIFWGKWINPVEPISEKNIGNIYDIVGFPVTRINNYWSRTVSCNENSIIVNSMMKEDTSVWSHGYLETYNIKTDKIKFLYFTPNYYVALSCIGKKIIALEEILTPFRYYNLWELNLNDPNANRLLFQLDSSNFPKKIYHNMNTIDPYFSMFNVYESCDQVKVYVHYFVYSGIFTVDSFLTVKQIDFTNKKLIPTCTIKSEDNKILSFALDGINPFGYLTDCKLNIDLDIDNSTDKGKNCSINYECAQEMQKLHDIDWNFYCDGPLDSIQVEISKGNNDSAEEYVIAKYIPPGIQAYGNGTAYLRLISTNKYYTNEINKILDGIVYYNSKIVPTPGFRDIRISVFVPWFEDTVFCKINIPKFLSAGKDSTITLCPDGSVLNLEQYLEDEGAHKGWWLEPEVGNGILQAGITPTGEYHFLLDRGNCKPDTAIIKVQYYRKISLDLGQDTIVEENQFCILDSHANILPTDHIRWFEDNKLIDSTGISISFKARSDVKYSIEIESEDGCVFKDEVLYKISVDEQLWIPNIFSPNNDNINDLFYVSSNYTLTLKSFEIFDRWGNQLFAIKNITTNDINYSWNGKVGTDDVPNGVYIYHTSYFGKGNVLKERAGNILLVR